MTTSKVLRTKIEQGADGRHVQIVAEEEVAEQKTYLIPVWDEDGNGKGVIEEPLFEEVDIPEQRVVRVHRTARVFKEMIASGFDPREPEQYFRKLLADEALPGMPTQADWAHGELSMGDLFTRKWLAVEMLAIVCNVIWGRVKELDIRLGRLERTARAAALPRGKAAARP